MTAVDFTSACYLGLHHPSRELGPWDRYTTGAPAALTEPAGAHRVAAEIAVLQGTQRALLARSTLHAFVDCMAVLRGSDHIFVIDSASYPIAHWVFDNSPRRILFQHHNVNHLRRALAKSLWGRHRPIIVTDGLCAGCGVLAPLEQYRLVARATGGVVLIDDTQALGLIGHTPTRRDPYGRGGGGSLATLARVTDEMICVSSLAKGLGVPVASIAGPAAFITAVERLGPSRIHCSAPPISDIRAAAAGLLVNRSRGDRLRRRLAALLSRWRAISSELGLTTMGGLSPVQRFDVPRSAPNAVLRSLAEQDIRAIITRPGCADRPMITIIMTTDHQVSDLDRLGAALHRHIHANHRPAATS